MNSKDKAAELVLKFQSYADTYHYGNLSNAKQCALILVDEILKSEPTEPSHTVYWDVISDLLDPAKEYWESVKQEIEKL